MAVRHNNPRIGLALGGGAVLGASHVGVLQALEEEGIGIHCIAGTSIGAFVGALYASGLQWREIEKLSRDLNWMEVTRLQLSRFGLLSNERLGNVIRDRLGDPDFCDTKIPLAVVATDITSGEKVVLNRGNIADAVMASTCIPGVFVPVEINGRMLVDGGLVENVPYSPLRSMGADFILGVDLNAHHGQRKPQNIVEVLVNAFSFILMQMTRIQAEQADFTIAPDLSAFSMIDTDPVPELIQVGLREGRKAMRALRSRLDNREK